MSLQSLAIVALIGAMPIFLLVASLMRKTVAEAQPNTMHFLERWGGIAPSGLREWLRITIGATAGFGLLMALAQGFNELGDATMPRISSVFAHFGDPFTTWSVRDREDWRGLRDGVKGRWVNLHPAEDLVNDPAAWNKWQDDRGKGMVRSIRALVFFAFMLVLAGVFDLTARPFRGRGVATIVVGLLALTALVQIWVDRKSHYIREVHLANETLRPFGVTVPSSSPGAD